MRTHVLLAETEEYNIFLITWPPGTGLDWHDHGDSYASITVLQGELMEYRVYSKTGYYFVDTETFDVAPNKEHKVVNESNYTAISLHTYWPPLKMEYSEELEIKP